MAVGGDGMERGEKGAEKRRRKKAPVLICCGLLLLFAVFYGARWYCLSQVTALTYHSISEQPLSEHEYLSVRPDDFAVQLDFLQQEGYRFIFADQLSQARGRTVILTFDDGYADNYTVAFPMLQERGLKATVFMATSLIGRPGYLNEEQLKEMADSGLISIQSHTASHHHLNGLTKEQVMEEYQASQRELERITGQSVEAVAYPYGEANIRTAALALGCYRYAYITDGRGLPLLYSRIPRITVGREADLEQLL